MTTCTFLKQGECSIGCKSLFVDKGGSCPYTLGGRYCPCHSEGLTFILADRANKVITEFLENGIEE